jgi:hypothetical protein
MKKLSLLLLILSITAFSQSKQLDSFIVYDYDEDSSIWEETYKAEFTYNANHKNTDEYHHNKDTGVWEQDYEIHYTYDVNNNVIEINGIESTTPFKSTLSYDSNNNLIEALHFSWNNTTNQWENSKKNVNTYNTNNKITESIKYNWDTSQWNNSLKNIYQYNTNNLLETLLVYYYDGSQWALDSTKTYTYDSNNLLIEILENNEYKTVLIYDSNSLLIEELYSELDTTTNIWEEEEKLVVTQYDSSIDSSHLTLPYSFTSNQSIEEDYLFFDKMVTELKFLELDDSWVDYGKAELFYSDITASTNDISKEILSIYPNPFTNELIINLPTQENIDLTLFDIQGRKVFNRIVLSTEKINVSSLENGVYFYEITVSNQQFKGKLVKR